MAEYHMTPYYARCSHCAREYPMYLTDNNQAQEVLFAHGWTTDGHEWFCPDCIGGE